MGPGRPAGVILGLGGGCSLIRGPVPNSVRAAPAVTTEPVIRCHARAAEPFALVAGLLDERRGGFDGVGERGRGDHPLRPEPLLGAQGQRFDVECAR